MVHQKYYKDVSQEDFWEDDRAVSSSNSTSTRFGIQTLENNVLGKKRREADALGPERENRSTQKQSRDGPHCRRRRR